MQLQNNGCFKKICLMQKPSKSVAFLVRNQENKSPGIACSKNTLAVRRRMTTTLVVTSH